MTTGLFDAIPASLESLRGARVDAVALVIEWADMDPRLGLRRLGGWSPSALPGIVEQAGAWLASIERLVRELAPASRVVVSLPTLPLPPLFHTAGWQAGAHELRLRHAAAGFAASLAEHPRIAVLSGQAIDAASAPAERLNVGGEWMSGFPYQSGHAAHLAGAIARAVRNGAPKKGLITDLDDTLWRGIVGDDGVEAIAWDLDRHAQAHGVYQQFLGALAAEGTLVGVASKNDPAVVEEAFARPDLLIPRDRIFPVAVSWGSKAAAVSRILADWNVHADSVVFVDDNPAELAEVKDAHPDLECALFPARDPRAVYDLLVRLRDLFGKPALSEEDALRMASLRSAASVRGTAGESEGYSERLLERAGAHVTIDFRRHAAGTRAFELVNKTNQFNLNGRRFTDRAWTGLLDAPGAFLLTASYRDRFGALGTIAVMGGRVQGGRAQVDVWVMSCRAFARRIEHQCLKALFAWSGAGAIKFDYAPTPRNGPLGACLRGLLGGDPAPAAQLTREAFDAACPPLFHEVVVIDDERHEPAAGPPDRVVHGGLPAAR